MKTGSIIISIIGCIFIFQGLISFLLYGHFSPDLFLILGGIFWIILGVYTNKGYYNKNSYMAVFSVIALWGLLLLYIFLFRTSEYLRDMSMFYINTGLFIVLIIGLGGYYIRTRKKLDL